jgi:hypothetical protein
VLALFDVGLDEALRQEGTAREIVSRVQQLRKKAALSPEDFVEIFYSTQVYIYIYMLCISITLYMLCILIRLF